MVWCKQTRSNENIDPGIMNEITTKTESNEQTWNIDAPSLTEQFSGELTLIQKGMIPDCRWLDWVPFYVVSADELKKSGMPASQIADIAKNWWNMVYCARQAWVDESKIIQNLMSYWITEKTAKEVVNMSLTEKQAEEIWAKEVK